MNLSSSLWFGILFLLKASIALSAPHSAYPDEDEEALIDKLASLAAAVGPEAFLSSVPKPQQQRYLPQNYDFAANYLSSAGGGGGGIGSSSNMFNREISGGPADEDLMAREAVLKLPREFGYKPNDIRFYLPAEQFPPPQQQQQQQLLDEQQQQQQEEISPPKINFPPPPVQQKAPPPPPPPPPSTPQRVTHSQGQNEFVMGDDKSDFYFMKKKEQIQDGGRGGGYSSSPIRSYIPAPSHIMASEHSASYPGFTSSQMPNKPFSMSDMYYIAIVAGCSAAAVVGIIAAGICWYRIHERIKAAADVDYPAYGVTGPSKDITPSGGGDRKLAQSAQMYHYQHQKQQMAALQKGSIQGDRQGSGGSDVESDDDNEDGDYTVYECPGLAPAGEMEVKNPLFNDDQPTPATPSNGASAGNKQQHHQQQQQDSSSAAESSSASSSSASSTATVTSSTPKVTESPKTPPAQPQPASTSKPEKEKGKGDKK